MSLMGRATAAAYANLAFVKYWGKTDHDLNLPLNGSISMTLSEAKTTTVVEVDETLSTDHVILAGANLPDDSRFAQRVSRHLDRLRVLAGSSLHARIATENTFPAATGFASSASGLAALTVAGAAAYGLKLTERELSIIARQGSGSACRSIPAGFVEWFAGSDDSSSYAAQIAAPQHWDIVDVAVIVSANEKQVSSSLGHRLALRSPFWEARQGLLPQRLEVVREAIMQRDFETFGRELESEALAMHTIALTSAYEDRGHWRSGIYYWTPDTLQLLLAVQEWRGDGLPVYFTLDAGPTVHLICPAVRQNDIIEAVKLCQKDRQWSILVNRPAPGAHLLSE